MPRKKTQPSPGCAPGSLYAFPVYDGRFGCLQVLPDPEPGDWVRICALDTLWPKVPTVAEALRAKLRTTDALGLGVRTDVTCVRPVVPYWAIPIGIGEPFVSDGSHPAMGDDWRGALDLWRDSHPYNAREGMVVDDSVTSLSVAVDEPTILEVPATLESLSVTGDASLLTVKGITGKFPSALFLSGRRVASLPKGLPELEELAVESDYVDANAIANHTSLKVIHLTGQHGGKLAHARCLSALAFLRGFVARDFYDLDGANFPVLSSVDYVSLRWVRRSDAETIMKRLPGLRHSVVLGTRTDAWIAENSDNPFRDWQDDSSALASAAKKAWKAARAAKRAKPENVLNTFIDALNKIDARYDLETHHREQAHDAFLALAKDLGVAKRPAEKIFALRTF